MNGKTVTSGDITVEGLCPNAEQSISLCLWVNGRSTTLRTIEFTTKDVNISIGQENDVTTATLKPTITADDGLTIKKVYWTNYEGEDLHLTGLLPDTKYTFTLNVETEYGDNKNYNTTKTVELTTQKLAIATLPAQAMNTKTALLCAETNLSEEEENVGFEWRRYDAPASLPSSKVTCAVTDGKMMGALSNLNPDVYYNYRPYYTTSNGQSYYGEWITFFTGDAAVFFDPTVKTYSASTVSETSAVLKGYALRGSEEIARQGFQLWNEWGMAREERNMARAAASGVREIVVSGQKMTCTLTDLEPGTTYKYRTFVETTDGKTTYGDEMEFTTTGIPTAIDNAIEEAREVTGYYNLQGHRLNGLQKGINVIRYSDGSARKMMVK